MSIETLLTVLQVVASLCQTADNTPTGFDRKLKCERELLECATRVTDAGAIPTELFNCTKKIGKK